MEFHFLVSREVIGAKPCRRRIEANALFWKIEAATARDSDDRRGGAVCPFFKGS